MKTKPKLENNVILYNMLQLTLNKETISKISDETKARLIIDLGNTKYWGEDLSYNTFINCVIGYLEGTYQKNYVTIKEENSPKNIFNQFNNSLCNIYFSHKYSKNPDDNYLNILKEFIMKTSRSRDMSSKELEDFYQDKEDSFLKERQSRNFAIATERFINSPSKYTMYFGSTAKPGAWKMR
jgi:hypothetical protein